jgi:hypothetical protein
MKTDTEAWTMHRDLGYFADIADDSTNMEKPSSIT